MLPEDRDERCKNGCTFPVIDFDSGDDTTYVCGQEGHGLEKCGLKELTDG
jgi:hypothetical protein